MKNFAKMVILLAMKEYPGIDHDNCPKARFIVNKFIERYKGVWGCCLFKEGEAMIYVVYYSIEIKYGNYIFHLFKTAG